MTEEEFSLAFYAYILDVVNGIRGESVESYGHRWIPGRLPYDTGNLANNAFKITKTATGYKIYIDQGVAPYASEIDKGNYYTSRYWDDLCEGIIERISEDWGGSLVSHA